MTTKNRTNKILQNYKLTDLPKSINILGINYDINYYDLPNKVDSDERRTLFGQIDYWKREIKIFHKDRKIEDIFITLLHEILHAIDSELRIDLFSNSEDEENNIEIFSGALFDILNRNNWLYFP